MPLKNVAITCQAGDCILINDEKFDSVEKKSIVYGHIRSYQTSLRQIKYLDTSGHIMTDQKYF